MRAVLDTNVVVSAMLTPGGTCSRIIDLWDDGLMEVLMTEQVEQEYQRVLHNTALHITRRSIGSLLARVREFAQFVSPDTSAPRLPDPDDTAFLECALGGLAHCIVTGNRKHFPAKACRGVRVVSPAEFLELFRRRGR